YLTTSLSRLTDCGLYYLILSFCRLCLLLVFFFNAPAPTEIYTLSLHDALPISARAGWGATSPTSRSWTPGAMSRSPSARRAKRRDRKSTRLKLQSRENLVCRLLLEKKKKKKIKFRNLREHKH